MEPIILNFPESARMTDDEFFEFCQLNRDLKFERNPQQQIILMTPTGGDTGSKNTDIITELNLWKRAHTGKVFDSSTGFRLKDNSVLSPDASWIPIEKWDALTEEQQKKFLPICPDFVIELMSESDSLTSLQTKMQQWLDNGCRLAWLICPQRQEVYIYQPGQPVQAINTFEATLSGEDVLPGFSFELSLLLEQ